MEETKVSKKILKPNSGRRGKDGAVGLVSMTRKFTPAQVEKIRRNGSAWLRGAVDAYPDDPNAEGD